MRFCDKLPKLRKNNNMSQEQLADKLGVSRQAISKWEAGSSYPDMDKMIQICKILNCTLDDLLDDGMVNKNGKSKTNKNDFISYYQDLLKFITKTYNMFCSMSFKEQIKCLFEMFVIVGFLFILGSIAYTIIITITHRIFNMLPEIGYYINTFLDNIFVIAFIILGTIITLHIYKIRYLDYFVTIEDSNVSEKTIEEPIEKKNKRYVEKEKERIIIRDPKHSTFSFFDFLAKIILVLTKCLGIIALVPILTLFVFLVFSMAISFYHILTNSIFLWSSIAIIGGILLVYIVIEIIFKFIFDLEENLKRMFIMFITGIVIVGLGTGITFIKAINLNKINNYDDLLVKTETINIEVKDTTALHGYINFNSVEYIYDDTMSNIRVELNYIDGYKGYFDHSIMEDTYYFGSGYMDFSNVYKLMINDIKNNNIRDYDNSYFMKMKIYMSHNTYNTLRDNHRLFN